MIELVERDDADLVCLQEVTAPLAGRLRASGAVREEMEVVCSSAVHTADGSMILSRLPIAAARELELPSIMNRALLAVEIATSAGSLTVATVHLESTRALAATRVAQLAEIFDALDDDTILAGDFNFDPRDPEEAALDPRFTDVWPLLRPSDPGYTEDTTRNRMRSRHHGERDEHVRYDRILARVSSWEPRSVELFATDPLAPGLHVSECTGRTHQRRRARRPVWSDGRRHLDAAPVSSAKREPRVTAASASGPSEPPHAACERDPAALAPRSMHQRATRRLRRREPSLGTTDAEVGASSRA